MKDNGVTNNKQVQVDEHQLMKQEEEELPQIRELKTNLDTKHEVNLKTKQDRKKEVKLEAIKDTKQEARLEVIKDTKKEVIEEKKDTKQEANLEVIKDSKQETKRDTIRETQETEEDIKKANEIWTKVKVYINNNFSKNKSTKVIELKVLYKHILFPVVFCYLEFVFHLFVFKSIDNTIVFPLLFAIVVGCFVNFWASCFNENINKVIAWVTLTISCLVFGIQLVYNHIFKTFLSIYSVGQNGADVMEYWKEAMLGILAVLPGLFFLLLPLLIFGLILKTGFTLEREPMKKAFLPLGSAVVLHVITILFLFFYGTGAHSPYDLYFNKGLMDLSTSKLGLFTSIRGDISNVVFGDSKLVLDNQAYVEFHNSSPTVIVGKGDDKDSETLTEVTPSTALVKLTPTPTPIDESPNILNIDFGQLASKESDDTIKTLHTYFSNAIPTKKNEYTGMFEGYNFIFLTAEGFSPWAVDKNVTPTLYRLTHEGFVFNNFYTPIWYTSTSDGEYVACTGLIPSGTNSFSKSSENSLPLCFGWQFQSLGYSARAYHNHSYKYYNRDKTHPNMGYDYKGANGGGLEVKSTWPESDLEMMQLTLPEYINDDKFHVYYMTVSGHMYYTFAGNSMSSKNKAYVEGLPYSNNVKAYVAAQKELDLALEYLIKELDKKGILDNTVIAMSADHYPYGLTNEEISEVAGHSIEENFELYKNNFILWNSAMKNPVIVDKYCSSLDIIPTLSNLFGIPYDSRLFMGQDILSDATPLVMFGNQSFITDQVMYNSKSGDIIKLTDNDLPEDYVKKYISVVRNKFNVSASILKNDYFSFLLPYLKSKKK